MAKAAPLFAEQIQVRALPETVTIQAPDDPIWYGGQQDDRQRWVQAHDGQVVKVLDESGLLLRVEAEDGTVAAVLPRETVEGLAARVLKQTQEAMAW